MTAVVRSAGRDYLRSLLRQTWLEYVEPIRETLLRKGVI